MENANLIYNHLENNIPVCFIKLNDGEISGLNPLATGISRGDERSSILMAEKIRNALNFRHDNYFIGLPCKICNGGYYQNALNNITVENEENKMKNVLDANILINTNTDRTLEVLKNVMSNKKIVIVTNNINSRNISKLASYNIIPYRIIEVVDKYAFETDYERVKDEWKNLNDGDIVICLCGPLGRILCYEWFSCNNNLTCLELGSLFDPLLKNRSYLYHTGNHQYCELCYPSLEANDCSMMALCEGPIHKECYYFYDRDSYLSFYGNNWKKIKKNSEIRLEKDPNDATDFLNEMLAECQENNKVKLDLINYKGSSEFTLDNSIPRENNIPFYVIYHIATIGENWRLLTSRTYNKIIFSGIADDKNCKGIKITYIGNEDYLNEFKNIWNHPKVEIHNFGKDVQLYEYPAISLIKDICNKEECNILYIHCKGVLHPRDKITDWINLLEYFNIEKYKYSLDRLIDYDVVGCNYYPKTGNPGYVRNPYPSSIIFENHYSGNFWWAKSSYINTLPRVPLTKDRFIYEFWICNKNDEGNFWSFYNPGINFGGRHSNTIQQKFGKENYANYEKINFNFVYKKKAEDIYYKYKNNTKNQLFNLANGFYNSSNIIELNLVCDLYISYFNEFNDDQLRKIYFFKGFANYNINPAVAIECFEHIYNDEALIESERFYTMCNLSNLYPRIAEPIPKIIHLLYFGETEFTRFHYECIKSMIFHMPDYKILMYNNKQPIGNAYWDELKPKFTIKSVYVPETFDGLVLQHFQYKADVVRLELLYEYGGIYLDIDMLIIKNFEPILNSGHALYISEEHEKGGGLINAFIAAKPKNEFLKIWLDSFKTGLRMENWAYHIREQNKRILNKNKHYFLKYNINILESKYFFPFRWEETHKFINIEENLNDDIYGIHLFETILGHVLVDNKFWNKKTKDDKINIKDNKKNLPCDEIVILTLEEYPENHLRVKKEFEKYGIDITLLINKKHVHPIIGCLESHMKAIEYAKNKNLDAIMICEDDVKINEDINAIEYYPKKWDMIYFGGILTHHTIVDNEWIKGVIWCNHAYIVKSNLYDEVLNIYNSLDKTELLNTGRGTDWLYTTFINPRYYCWLRESQPIVQREGYSLIENGYRWKEFNWSTWSIKNYNNAMHLNLIAITVSTNYSDILVHCLNNKIFFKKWYIITDVNDKNTIDLINSVNQDNKIVILYHDFKNNSRKFDKGGAIRLAQEVIYETYKDETILIIDSDIILPLSFGEQLINTEISADTIYNPKDRINYLTYDDYKNNNVASRISDKSKSNENWKIAGYFQLYKSNKYFYVPSYNCGECDLQFHKLFQNNGVLNVEVSHLGIDSDWPVGQNNWNGRIVNTLEQNISFNISEIS